MIETISQRWLDKLKSPSRTATTHWLTPMTTTLPFLKVEFSIVSIDRSNVVDDTPQRCEPGTVRSMAGYFAKSATSTSRRHMVSGARTGSKCITIFPCPSWVPAI